MAGEEKKIRVYYDFFFFKTCYALEFDFYI